jgi:1,4-alpha-glucan branching enzyme
MYVHPGKKLLFMGSEIGQWREWNHDASLDWHLVDGPLHGGLQLFVADLNRRYRAEPALHELDFDPNGFEWIDCNDHESSVVSLIRRARDPNESVVAVLNWTPIVRRGYRIGVPASGFYRELINSDAGVYGGSNTGNGGGCGTEAVPAHGHPYSLNLTLPPLGGLILKRESPGQDGVRPA